MRNLALLSSLFLAACVVQSRPTNVPPWRIDRRLVLGEPGRPQVILEADWRLEGNRYCVSRAPVDLVTPAGPLRLNDAELCATQRPPAHTCVAGHIVPVPQAGPPRGGPNPG